MRAAVFFLVGGGELLQEERLRLNASFQLVSQRSLRAGAVTTKGRATRPEEESVYKDTAGMYNDGSCRSYVKEEHTTQLVVVAKRVPAP
jgi:hypothetical protein